MRMRRWLAVVLAGICLLGTSGCQFGNTAVVVGDELGANDVFKIGNTVCTLPEIKVYLCNYQNILGTSYGIDLWEHESDTEYLVNYVKSITMSEITRIVCMDEMAVQREIVLTEEEQKKAESAAKYYFESLSTEEIDYMGVSQKLLTEMYQDYALAQKLNDALIRSVNNEVSDDEARVMEIQQIFVSSVKDSSQVRLAIDEGKDFLAIAADYNEAPQIELFCNRSTFSTEMNEIIFDLEDGEISKAIETDEGYYYIKCINKYNQELTEENKLNIVEQREKAALEDTYAEFVASQDSVLNSKVWQEVDIVLADDISTDSFFEVYEKYFLK